MALCDVCAAEASKYKCATCKAPSCSLPCFKTHAAQCTANPAQSKPVTVDSTAGISDATRKESLKEQPRQPSSVELDELFRRHPTLRTQLQNIYKVTQRPEESSEQNDSFRSRFNSRGRGRGSFAHDGAGDARHWTLEKGFNRGLKQLQRILDQETDQGEALRVFAAAIRNTTKIKQPEYGVGVLGP